MIIYGAQALEPAKFRPYYKQQYLSFHKTRFINVSICLFASIKSVLGSSRRVLLRSSADAVAESAHRSERIRQPKLQLLVHRRSVQSECDQLLDHGADLSRLLHLQLDDALHQPEVKDRPPALSHLGRPLINRMSRLQAVLSFAVRADWV